MQNITEAVLAAHEAAMQAFENEERQLSSLMEANEAVGLPARVYHEAPDDIIEHIISTFSDMGEYGGGKEGMNALRLVSKRLMHGVEACATRITNYSHGLESLPIALLKRCKRIEQIGCRSMNLISLEGCPAGLKSLCIAIGPRLQSLEPLSVCIGLESLEIRLAYLISDLSPLVTCTKLKKLCINDSQVTDISALASMPLLEEFNMSKEDEDLDLYDEEGTSVSDLSPLSHCSNLKELHIGGNRDIKDLSPLSQCTQLENLDMWGLIQITDLKPLSVLTNLKDLDIQNNPVKDLTPLSALHNLEGLFCSGIPLSTSLLPLAICVKLNKLYCSGNAKDLRAMKERMPGLDVDMREGIESEEEDEDDDSDIEEEDDA